MSKFRRKDGEVDAVQWDGNAHVANTFVGDRYGIDWEYTAQHRSSIWVLTAVGHMSCEVGDWLVKSGEKVWVVEAEEFPKLYGSLEA